MLRILVALAAISIASPALAQEEDKCIPGTYTQDAGVVAQRAPDARMDVKIFEGEEAVRFVLALLEVVGQKANDKANHVTHVIILIPEGMPSNVIAFYEGECKRVFMPIPAQAVKAALVAIERKTAL